MQSYLNVWRNYATFSGRATRTEYWMFYLFNYLTLGILLLLDFFVFGTYGLITGLYSLAAIIPSLAVVVRRLHDTGRGGAWFLISFIPGIGGIILLIFMLEASHLDNHYGPKPQ